MTTQVSPVDRPNPLKNAASKVGTAWAAASGVVSALVTFGVLSAAQGEAITLAGAEAQNTVTADGTVVAGVLPLITGVVASFRTVAAAKDDVTPVASPRDNLGNVLTPDVPVAGPVTAAETCGDSGVVAHGDTWTS
jgi:hypothetical protein